MWQLLVIIGICFNCIENIIDKKALLHEIDSEVATFIRVFLYVVIALLIVPIFVGGVDLYISPGTVCFGLISANLSRIYTTILKEADVTAVSALSYAAPLVYLAIDEATGRHLTIVEMLSITGLVLGGIMFVMDTKLKFNWRTCFLLTYMVGYGGLELYYFKYLSDTIGLSGISFFASIWLPATIFLAINVIARGKLLMLIRPNARRYWKYSFFAKSCDVVNSVLCGIALANTTVSKFSALEILYPPIMLAITLLVQESFAIELGETVNPAAIMRKCSASILLMVCGCFI